MARSTCPCGAERDQVAIELHRRFRCPRCGNEETIREVPPPPGEPGGPPPPPWPSEAAAPGETATILKPRGPATTASVHFLPPAGLAERSAEIAPGTEVGGFRIVELLGSGGMGVVYRARDEALARDVALKVLSAALCRNRLFVERFRREARAAAALNHPNITTIYAIGEEQGSHFYAMELVRGKSLTDLLEERGPLPPLEAARIIRQAAEGLGEAAARQIIHRDVKPSNLLVSETGTVKVTDFGLAKAFLGAVDQTATGVVMGTPIYMSPEQGTGRPVDHRSDIYSLGVTLYQLVYGRPPFVAESAISLMVKHLQEEPEFPADEGNPKPAALVCVIRKMLEKDPARRYASYGALVADLAAFAEGRPVAAARDAPPPDDGVLVLRRAGSRSAGPGGEGPPAPRTSGRTMARSRISVARASLGMARADRALSLLRDVIREDADNRCEAALLLAGVCEKEKDFTAAREAFEIVARESRDPAERAYANLKLAVFHEGDAIERDRAALAAYEDVIARAPEGLALGPLEARAKALRTRIDAAERALARTQVVLLD